MSRMPLQSVPRRWSFWMLLIFVIMALVGKLLMVDAGAMDIQHILSSPWIMNDGHFFGTDALGRDVLAGVINGTQIAITVGLLTCFFSLILGLPLGIIAGYYGNDWKLGIFELVLLLLVLFASVYLLVYFPNLYAVGIMLSGFLLFFLFRYILDQFWPKRIHLSIPIDDFLSRFTEVFKSIPSIIILILLLALWQKTGVFSIALSLGLLLWVKVSRLIRAEILALKSENFIEAQRSIGSSDLSILWRHCLPKAMSPVLVYFIFLFGTAILMEATLSFLGLGLPIEEVSWGSMLNESRKYLRAWWIAVIPGICLFVLLASLAAESKYWSKKFENRIWD